MDGLLLFYCGAIVTVLAFFLMYDGVSQVSANAAGVLTGLLPISTVIFASAILQESLQ
jgi:drug/metabolite transporter (DMT)-like permease